MVARKRKTAPVTTNPIEHGARLSTKIFAERRERFIAQLLPNSVALIVSNSEKIRSNDVDYPYRQSSDVLYLSDFPEPQTVLILSNLGGKPDFKMIVRPRDKLRETWNGRRFGVEGAIEKFGPSDAYSVDQFSQVIKDLLSKAENFYHKFERNQEFDRLIESEWKKSSCSLHDPEKITNDFRMIKTKEELVLMRKAAAISAEAHCQAMKLCRVGMMEYQLQAELERIFKLSGANGPAYSSIVAGGANAVVLHYVENDMPLQNGDLCYIDAACEYHGYASDMTRTFPINGHFSQSQLEIYNLVLAAQLAAIAMAKPGVTLMQIHEKAANILRKGLIDLGVLSTQMSSLEAEEKALKQSNKNGNKSTPLVLRDLFMHGTSHWLGLDVHDVCTIGTRSNYAKTIPLKPGMVFTIEPGLYFDPADKRLPKKYRGIGVRIEDDIAITASGCEVLSAAAPKIATEIEALMAAKLV